MDTFITSALTLFIFLFIGFAVDAQNTRKESPCKGEWKVPEDCTGYGCTYVLQWEYIDDTDDILFVVATKNRNKWTGVGFSADKRMPETDAIVGLVEETGRFFVMDMWLKGYEVPPLDSEQNLHNMSAWRENGITNLRFFRKRITGDKNDFQFTDDNCPYLMFPVEGGLFNAVNKRIRQHEATPIVSENRVCIKSCRVVKPKIETPKVALVKADEEELSTKVTKPKTEEVEVKKEAVATMKDTPKTDEVNTVKSVATSVKAIETKPEEPDFEEESEAEMDSEAKQSVPKVHNADDVLQTDNTKLVTPNVLTTIIPESSNKELTTSTKPIFCSFDIKLLNAWKPNFVTKNSTDYYHLKFLIEDKVRSELDNEFEVKNAVTRSIDRIEDSEDVTASVTVEVFEYREAADDKQVPLELQESIKALFANQKIGNLTVDPSYLTFKNTETIVDVSSKVKRNGFQLTEEQLKWVVIIGGVTALVVLVVVQALCMLWRDNRNKKKHSVKEKQMVNSHWKDYSATTTSSAYCYENFAVSDDLDGCPRTGKSAGKMRNGQKAIKCAEKSDYSSFFNGTVDRHKYSKDRDFHSPPTTVCPPPHDRRDEERFYAGSHTLPLQPDFYFMPHQRRYSGEVVRVFVDYNNPKSVRK